MLGLSWRAISSATRLAPIRSPVDLALGDGTRSMSQKRGDGQLGEAEITGEGSQTRSSTQTASASAVMGLLPIDTRVGLFSSESDQ